MGALRDGMVFLENAPDAVVLGSGFAGVEGPHSDGDWKGGMKIDLKEREN